LWVAAKEASNKINYDYDLDKGNFNNRQKMPEKLNTNNISNQED